MIIRGIRKDNPAAYRVVIGTNLDRAEAGGKIVMCAGQRSDQEG